MERELVKPIFRIGDKCKCFNSAAFRYGTPFVIIGILPFYIRESSDIGITLAIGFNPIYIVQYEDGVIDYILVKSEIEYGMVKI